ncbi:MAG: DNA sulfur modification protein DndD [Spirulina sp.]
MRFRELVLENFGPYRGRQTIELSPENKGEHHPIVLLGGMNGGGKTTLMDAIRLAFYGQRAQCSTRGNLSYQNFLEQCINRNTKATEETKIELAFDHVKDNKPVVFRIRRRWTKNPKNGKDSLEVITDTWLDDTITKTWDERVEYILPIGISNLFLFDGEQVKELAELDTPPPQVVEAIQSLLGLELAERLSADLDILASRKRKELATKKELKDLETLESQVVQLRDKKEQIQEDRSRLKGQISKAEWKYDRANEKFLTEGGEIASRRSKVHRNIEKLKKDVEKERSSLRDRAAYILPLSLISPLLTTAKEIGEQELENHAANIARETILARDNRLLNYLQDLSLTLDRLEKIKAFLERENHRLVKASATQGYLEADRETLNTLELLLRDRLPEQIKGAKQECDRLQNLEEQIISLEEQLQTAASPETYTQLEKERNIAKKSLIQLGTELEAKKRQIEEIDREIEAVKKALETYGQETIDRTNNEHIIQSIAKVKQTLKLFRERLTLKKLNKLEVEVTQYFRHLLHKSDLVHTVTIDTDSFKLSLYDPQGQEVPKHRLSAGEKQLLAIAFLWGLAKISGRNLPIAIDTPLGRLDSSHRANLVERYFPYASSQVILLSTDTEIGKAEYDKLQEQDAIARSYHLKYDPELCQTTIEEGYFWHNEQ